MIKIFDTLSGKKKNLKRSAKKPLRLFVCGPTVYDYAHIGNARTYLVFDIIVNYLRQQQYKVFYLQNITDIDDKIIKRAAEIGSPPQVIARKYTKAYHEDEKKIGINSVTKYAPATAYISQIIRQIQALLSKRHAYKIENDGYYFDISTFPDYGKLAKRTVLEAEDAISRIDESIDKRNKGDFSLWKFSKPGEPGWDTPLGRGRPGWHIEDTAITEYYFGPQYDLHGGAVDLKFPHHEAEIAQQESASGKRPMVKIWMHAGSLQMDGRKMSKSLGNLVTIRSFLKKSHPNTLRYLVASHHYRSPVDYTETLARQAKNALAKITEFSAKLDFLKPSHAKSNSITMSLKKAEKQFNGAMSDDFNTPEALAAIFNLINEINPKIWNLSEKEAVAAKKWLWDKLKIFGVSIELPQIPQRILRLAQQRELLRDNKQFMQADNLRKRIERLRYRIEDTPQGMLILKL